MVFIVKLFVILLINLQLYFIRIAIALFPKHWLLYIVIYSCLILSFCCLIIFCYSWQGFWYGIEWDEQRGKHNGSYQGEVYFSCRFVFWPNLCFKLTFPWNICVGTQSVIIYLHFKQLGYLKKEIFEIVHCLCICVNHSVHLHSSFLIWNSI